MPYFQTDDTNILFIHIPKTGGTSLDSYFLEKYKLSYGVGVLLDPYAKFEKIAYQHLPLKTIMANAKKFGVHFNNLRIITIVRNPYHRFVSEIAFLRLIDDNTQQSVVFNHLKNLIIQFEHGILRDNHLLPQHKMLEAAEGKIPSNITILKTENLNQMVHDIGFTDFNLREHKSKLNRDYMDFLNRDSINFINNYYKKDFEYFGYEMI